MSAKRVPSKQNEDESRKTADGRNGRGQVGYGHPTRRLVCRTMPRQTAAPPQPHRLPLDLGDIPTKHPMSCWEPPLKPGKPWWKRSTRLAACRTWRSRTRPTGRCLIPEGEILIGAKQNRVVNVTVLVAAGVKFLIPVSCVEAGRWRYRSRHFESKFHSPPSLRHKKLKAIHRNRSESGVAASDQGEVWEEVQACLNKVGAQSETALLTDGFLASEERLEEYRHEFSLPTDAAGVLVAKGTRRHRHGPVRFAGNAPGDVASVAGWLLLRRLGRQP